MENDTGLPHLLVVFMALGDIPKDADNPKHGSGATVGLGKGFNVVWQGIVAVRPEFNLDGFGINQRRI
jgi:hypothetical protein